MGHRLDITLRCSGTDTEGKEVLGFVTARIDVDKASWPDQQWDGSPRGSTPLQIASDAAPIRILEVLQVNPVTETDDADVRERPIDQALAAYADRKAGA